MGVPNTVTVLDVGFRFKLEFAIATVKVPLAVVVIPKVYVVPEPLRVPLVTPVTPLRVISLALRLAGGAGLNVKVNVVVAAEVEPLAVTLLNVTGVPYMKTVLEAGLKLKPDFATATVKVPLRVVVIPRVYVGPVPLRVPLVTPVTPLNVMSLADRFAIALSKVSVNCVVTAEIEPFAVTLLNVSAAT